VKIHSIRWDEHFTPVLINFCATGKKLPEKGVLFGPKREYWWSHAMVLDHTANSRYVKCETEFRIYAILVIGGPPLCKRETSLKTNRFPGFSHALCGLARELPNNWPMREKTR
jgi:hypothetical protein